MTNWSYDIVVMETFLDYKVDALWKICLLRYCDFNLFISNKSYDVQTFYIDFRKYMKFSNNCVACLHDIIIDNPMVTLLGSFYKVWKFLKVCHLSNDFFVSTYVKCIIPFHVSGQKMWRACNVWFWKKLSDNLTFSYNSECEENYSSTQNLSLHLESFQIEMVAFVMLG